MILTPEILATIRIAAAANTAAATPAPPKICAWCIGNRLHPPGYTSTDDKSFCTCDAPCGHQDCMRDLEARQRDMPGTVHNHYPLPRFEHDQTA